MKTFTEWFRWITRRGVRGSLLLNMRPGDEVVAMIQYRQYLAISTRGGELYIIDGDKLVEFREAEIQSHGHVRLPETQAVGQEQK